ncbi:hypothetical protein D3C72_1321340 [compost metagenome]
MLAGHGPAPALGRFAWRGRGARAALASRWGNLRPPAGLHRGRRRCPHRPRARGADHLGADPGPGARRGGTALRRGAAHAQDRAGAAGGAGVRQDPPGRTRRSAGDDRHLRLCRGTLTPAARADDCLGAPRARDARDLASVRAMRGDFGVQLPGGGVGVERGAGAGLRQWRGLEAVGEDAAVRAGRAGAARSGIR